MKEFMEKDSIEVEQDENNIDVDKLRKRIFSDVVKQNDQPVERVLPQKDGNHPMQQKLPTDS
jgi:hypothetical protein